MLAHYFGFEENPFGDTPDPRYLFASRTHREALASLHYAYYSNRGFTAMIAPPGMGKTTLLFEFLQQIRTSARTAFIFNSQCDSADLVGNILTEIGLTPHESAGKMLQQLNNELVQTAHIGRNFVVVVDEAQNLSEQALETLRLLTNFETPRSKLMQIVLSGQPQLDEKITRPGLVQLRQRVSTFCRLEPFSPDETAAYIDHRLNVASYHGTSLFTTEALAGIAEASEGIPRNINTLCFNTLSMVCALKKKRVDLAVLKEVLEDLHLGMREPGKQEGQTVAIRRNTARPEAHQREGRVKAMRVSALAVLVLIAVLGGSWATQMYTARHQRAEVLLPKPAPQRQLTVASTIEKEKRPDTIEITVGPQQTLSGISVVTLGAFDDQVLLQIKQLNPGLENPDLIVPGQKLLLPSRRSLPQPDGRKGQ